MMVMRKDAFKIKRRARNIAEAVAAKLDLNDEYVRSEYGRWLEAQHKQLSALLGNTEVIPISSPLIIEALVDYHVATISFYALKNRQKHEEAMHHMQVELATHKLASLFEAIIKDTADYNLDGMRACLVRIDDQTKIIRFVKDLVNNEADDDEISAIRNNTVPRNLPKHFKIGKIQINTVSFLKSILGLLSSHGEDIERILLKILKEPGSAFEIVNFDNVPEPLTIFAQLIISQSKQKLVNLCEE